MNLTRIAIERPSLIIVLFGATRLPNIGRGLGEGIRNFKKGIKGGDEPEQLPGKTDSR